MSSPSWESAPASRLHRWLPLIVLLTVAAGVRLAALVHASSLPYFTIHRGDSMWYDAAGRAIADGDFLQGGEVLHMSPAYCYFVGLIYWLFGAGPWPIRLAQLMLGLATIALVAAGTRRIVGRKWSAVAAVIAALYGPFIFYEEQLLAETLAAFLHALLLLAALWAAGDPPRPSRWALVGLVWGLSIETRATAGLLAVPLLVLLAGRLGQVPWRRRLFSPLALVGGAALMVAPVLARNWLVAGEAVAVADSGGLNFYIGNGPGAFGTFTVPPELPEATGARKQFAAFRRAAETAAGRRLSSREVDAYWYGKTWDAITAEPARWLRLVGEKLWLYWNARELPNTEDYEFRRHLNPVLALPLVQFGWLAPLALVGTLLLIADRARERSFVGLVNVMACAAVVAFFVLGRYRIVAIPGLILASVACLARMKLVLAKRRWRASAVLALALAGAGVLAATPKLPKPFDDEYFKLGLAYHLQSRLDEAERAYLKALGVNPANLAAASHLAKIYEKRQEISAAVAQWRYVEKTAVRTNQRDHAESARASLVRLGVTVPEQP